jgi:hypothetical protein
MITKEQAQHILELALELKDDAVYFEDVMERGSYSQAQKAEEEYIKSRELLEQYLEEITA